MSNSEPAVITTEMQPAVDKLSEKPRVEAYEQIWFSGGWVSGLSIIRSPLNVKLDGVRSGWHEAFESVLVWGTKCPR